MYCFLSVLFVLSSAIDTTMFECIRYAFGFSCLWLLLVALTMWFIIWKVLPEKEKYPFVSNLCWTWWSLRYCAQWITHKRLWSCALSDFRMPRHYDVDQRLKNLAWHLDRWSLPIVSKDVSVIEHSILVLSVCTVRGERNFCVETVHHLRATPTILTKIQ